MINARGNLGTNISFMMSLAVALLFADIGAANAGIARIWAVDDGEKVEKTDNNHPLVTSSDNPVWNGSKISLFGAKNEVVAFQLIIEADASGVNNVDVCLDSLTNGSYVIKNAGSSDPFDYVGKRIELYTEHYVPIKDHWFPDALIPFVAPSGLGGAPFDIAANNNQAVWIDVYIPRDALPGIYKGNVELSIGSVVIHAIPVSLQVYDFALPDECHLKNMFVQGDWPAGSGIKGRHGASPGTPEYYEIERKYFQMAHRHRFDVVKGVENLTVMTERYKGYVDGNYYTATHNYEGPGENTGNRTFSVGPYNGRPDEFSPDNEAGWRAGSDAWVTWFKENAPHVEIHKYLRDEPWSHSGIYDDIIERCEWIHNNPGPGSALMTYVTCPIISELQGHCDFWSMQGQSYYLPDAVHEQSQGRKCGFYNGERPFYGAVTISTDTIDFRVQPWICWRYNVDQYFYWETTYWPAPNDLFSTGHRNGGGNFFYPGEDKVIPGSSRGLSGPLSSIRMKNWRRGMQDYEYLWLVREAGLDSEADAIVKSCVPAALSEADRAKGISWPSHGYGFELYRRQLADLIAGKTGTIKGTVANKATGDPVQGTKVTDGIRESTTDAAGAYSIDVIAGTRTLTATATGYEDKTQTGVEVTEGGATTVNFQLTQDTTSPVISDARATKIASTKVTISWDTDKASNSLVKYGTSPGVYTDSASDSAYVTSHSISVSGLSPDTPYYYVVSGSDRGGNSVASDEYDFKTLPALNLIGLWHFDEGEGTIAHDASGRGNDGTLVKGTTWVDGKIGKALEFDGVDDYVDCGNPESLDNIMDEITFMAYVKPFEAEGCIVQKWQWGGRWIGYHLDANPKRNTLNLIMGYGDRSVLILGASLAEHLNKFVHIAFTASDSEVIFYLNGNVASRTVPRKPIYLRNSSDVRIGGGSGWSGKYFNGVIDEVKIYGRALSAEEIKADYEGTP